MEAIVWHHCHWWCFCFAATNRIEINGMLVFVSLILNVGYQSFCLMVFKDLICLLVQLIIVHRALELL
jgi:hypothetical protein